MKISIILPVKNNPQYLSKILPYLKSIVTEEELDDIIIINGFENSNLVKLAKKANARLYVFKNSDLKLKAEAGAFEAKGETRAVKLKNDLGSLYHPWIAFICKFFGLPWMDRMVIWLSPMTNFFIRKNIFYRSGGLKYDGKTSSFYEFIQKSEFKSRIGLIQ